MEAPAAAAHQIHPRLTAHDAHQTLASLEYRPELTTSELIAEVHRLLRIERGAERLVCRYLADLVDGVWRRQALAFQPCVDELEAARCQFGLGPREARERVRIGRALRQLPAIERALVDGELSYSRVREITRVATPDSEAEWIEQARQLDMRTLERRVAQTQASAESAPGAESAGGKTRRVTFELSEEACLLLQRALEGARRASGDHCSDAQALEVVARAALAVQAAETGQHDPVTKTPSTNTNTNTNTSTGARKPVRPWSWDDLGWAPTQSGSSNERNYPRAAGGEGHHRTDRSTHDRTDRSTHGAANDSTLEAANDSTHQAAPGATRHAAGGTAHGAWDASTPHAAHGMGPGAANDSTRHATDGTGPGAWDASTPHAANGSTRDAAGGSDDDAVGWTGTDRGWMGDADDKWWTDGEPDPSDASERERASTLELDEWGAINSRLLIAMGGAGRWNADSLIEATGLSAREVNTALTFLELGGRIRRRNDAFEPI